MSEIEKVTKIPRSETIIIALLTKITFLCSIINNARESCFENLFLFIR